MYDAIVVGAGPAGSTAAKILADNGLRVLLAERRKLPRDKSCSGILIQKSLDLVRRCYGRDVPLSATCTPTENRGMVFTDDKGRELRFEQGGLNVWRSSFDHWLTEQAAASGAEIRDGVAAVFCEEQPDSVAVTLRGKSPYKERAKYLVDCEGVTGVLKRQLLGNHRDFITTFQTFNEGTIALDPHYFYAYLQPELSEYDAWFNVKDNMLVLGVSVRDAGRIRYFYQRLTAFLEKCHDLRIKRQVKAEKWLMPPYPARLPDRLWTGAGAVCRRGCRVPQSDGRGDLRRDGKRLPRGPSHRRPRRLSGDDLRGVSAGHPAAEVLHGAPMEPCGANGRYLFGNDKRNRRSSSGLSISRRA